jgi:hypothetical protein
MGLEDLFNRDHRRKREYHSHKNIHGSYKDRHGDNRYAPYGRDHRDENDQWHNHGVRKYNHHNDDLINLSNLVPHLLANKKLLISGGIVVLAVIVLAVIIVLPLSGQVLDFISQSGLQGVIDRLLQLTGGAK